MCVPCLADDALAPIRRARLSMLGVDSRTGR